MDPLKGQKDKAVGQFRIGKYNYVCMPLDPDTALTWAHHLISAAGPPLLQAWPKGGLKALLSDKSDPDMAQKLSSGLQMLLEKLPPTRMLELKNILRVRCVVEVNTEAEKGDDPYSQALPSANEEPAILSLGIDQVFTEHFMGKPKRLLQWLGLSVKAQFSDFFEDLPNILSRLDTGPFTNPVSASPESNDSQETLTPGHGG